EPDPDVAAWLAANQERKDEAAVKLSLRVPLQPGEAPVGRVYPAELLGPVPADVERDDPPGRMARQSAGVAVLAELDGFLDLRQHLFHEVAPEVVVDGVVLDAAQLGLRGGALRRLRRRHAAANRRLDQ